MDALIVCVDVNTRTCPVILLFSFGIVLIIYWELSLFATRRKDDFFNKTYSMSNILLYNPG